MAFVPSSIQLVQTQGFEEQVSERITVNPTPQGTQFLAVVVADKPVVQTGQVFVSGNADGSVTATLTTDRALAPGTYEGQLTVRLCQDIECRNEVSLAGNVLPYSIQVLPRVQLEVTGATSQGLGNPNSYSVDGGATVVITSNTPVTWSRGSSISGTDLEVISSTPTRWEGRILGSSGAFIGVLAASIAKPANNGDQVIFGIR
jgi:hypothetical protein